MAAHDCPCSVTSHCSQHTLFLESPANHYLNDKCMRIHRLFGLLVWIGAASLAHGRMPAQDTVKGARDHPLLSRFEGSKMVAYEVKEFDETSLPTSRRAYRNQPQGYYFEKKLDLEGKITRIACLVPRERSTLEVVRNYQSALEKAGQPRYLAAAGARPDGSPLHVAVSR